ncbi:MAG: RNA polymerase sigma factor [Clostridia bacterium]|nr:RNA polymerase sigma factor [Clostridia bacterium]
MEYQDTLYRVAKARLSSEDDVCDVVQNTLISAYRSIENLREPKMFKSWLLKILINKCNDFYASPERKNLSLEMLEEENSGFWESPQKGNFSEEMGLEYLISHLSQDEQTILTLYYVEGYSEKEIAKIMEIKYATVRTKIRRAKDKIALKLKKGEI